MLEVGALTTSELALSPPSPGARAVRAHTELSPGASRSYSVGGGRAGPLGPPQAVPPSKPSSPPRLVQRQAIDAPSGAQDVDRPAQGQNLQVPHLTRKRVHRLDTGRQSTTRTRFFRTNSSNTPAPWDDPEPRLSALGPAPRSPAGQARPGRSRSAASAPGRTRRPAPSRWTGRSPPRGIARGACPPPGPRVGGRSPPSSPRAA